MYSRATIASETGMSYAFIQKVGYSIDCGSNGFTATAPGGVSDLTAALKDLWLSRKRYGLQTLY